MPVTSEKSRFPEAIDSIFKKKYPDEFTFLSCLRRISQMGTKGVKHAGNVSAKVESRAIFPLYREERERRRMQWKRYETVTTVASLDP